MENHLIQNVNTASLRTDGKAIIWVQEVENHAITDEELVAKPEKRFVLLEKAHEPCLAKDRTRRAGPEV